MQPKPREAHDWPIIDNVIAPLAEWWRSRSMVHQNLESLGAFSPEEMARIAQDIGLSSTELRSLASYCSDAAELLERRLAAAGLDPKVLAKTAPSELRDMERLCTLCRSKGRCSYDLAGDPRDPAWREYCPNAAAISERAHGSAA